MIIRPLLTTAAKALALTFLTSLAAHAAYYKWEVIELPASSGASCGNGTPFRFFVNRTPLTSKTVVMYEGGGACWEQETCANKGGVKLGLSGPPGSGHTIHLTHGPAHLGPDPELEHRLPALLHG
jgi:hypothetical protein